MYDLFLRLHILSIFTRNRHWPNPLNDEYAPCFWVEFICSNSCNHFQSFPVDIWLFSIEFAACSKPPSNDDYRKAFYPKTQQCHQGVGWTHDYAIRVVLKPATLYSFAYAVNHNDKCLPKNIQKDKDEGDN